MKKHLSLFAAASAIALMGAGCLGSNPTDRASTEGGDGRAGRMDEARQESADNVAADLMELNDSNENGSVTLTDEDGKTRVTINVTGAPGGIAQPAHIHAGNCTATGAVLYPLTLVVNGHSETMLNSSLQGILSSADDISINVHKSESDLGTYVACAEIGNN